MWYYIPKDAGTNDVVAIVGGRSVSIARSLFDDLVPLLDGSRTIDDLIEALDGVLSPDQITTSIAFLARRGVVHDVSSRPPVEHGAELLSGLSVHVRAFGDLLPDQIQAALNRHGAGLVDTADQADFVVVWTDHYLRGELGDFNREAGRPWMVLGPNCHEMWIGPIFRPKETACWECLAHRLRLNRRTEQHIWQKIGWPQIPPHQSDLALGIAGMACEMAVSKIRDWRHTEAAGQSEAATSSAQELRLSVVNPNGLAVTHHPVLRRPQCDCCGTFTPGAPAPIQLRSSAKLHSSATSASNQIGSDAHRNVSAEAVLRQYAHHVSPVTGLVSNLTRTSQSAGIHVYKGGKYAAKTAETWRQLEQDLAHYAAGKGLTEAQAKASALAETLEWYSLGAPPNCKLVTESYNHLRQSERVLQPDQLVHFSAKQMMAKQAAAEPHAASLRRIPSLFDPDVKLEWRPVWSLSHSEWVFVPAAFCGGGQASPFIPTDSNGAAAGASLEDAIIHGFNELIERDAICLWWYNKALRPEVSLEGLDPGFLSAMNAFQSGLGRDFWLLDITTDLQVPTFAAVSMDMHGDAPNGLGFGTHSDARVAAIRALTELNQLMPIADQFVARADRPTPRSRTDKSDRHLQPDPASPARRLEDFTQHRRTDILQDIEGALDRTRDLGLEFLVADLTQPDVGLPVVKTIVPGLRHAYPEFGPGRLYEIPPKLEWCDAALSEDEMEQMSSPL